MTHFNIRRAVTTLGMFALVIFSIHTPVFGQWKQATGFSNANSGGPESLDFVYGFLPWGNEMLASAACAVDQDGATLDSLFLSSDNGMTWNSFAPNGGPPLLAISTGSPIPELIGTAELNPTLSSHTDVFSYSIDAGQTWTTDTTGWNNGGSDGTATYLANIGSTVFAVAGSGIYQQTTPGGTWTVDTVGLGFIFQYGFPLIGELFPSGNNLFLNTYINGVYISANMGATWTTVNTGLPNYFSPSGGFAQSGSSIYDMTTHDSLNDSYDFYRTTNNGQSWTLTNSTPQAWGQFNPQFIAVGATLFASSDSGLFVSQDNGATWTQRDEGLPAFQGSFDYVVAQAGGNLVINTPSNGVWYRPLSDFGISSVTPDQAAIQQISLSVSENPISNSSTQITYSLPEAGIARITLMDALCREIQTLQNGWSAAGENTITLNVQSLVAGTYFLRIESNGASTMQKISVIS